MENVFQNFITVDRINFWYEVQMNCRKAINLHCWMSLTRTELLKSKGNIRITYFWTVSNCISTATVYCDESISTGWQLYFYVKNRAWSVAATWHLQLTNDDFVRGKRRHHQHHHHHLTLSCVLLTLLAEYFSHPANSLTLSPPLKVCFPHRIIMSCRYKDVRASCVIGRCHKRD